MQADRAFKSITLHQASYFSLASRPAVQVHYPQFHNPYQKEYEHEGSSRYRCGHAADACNNANLNFDPYVDAYDLALFNSFYNAGARRVDMNTDGTTDSADAAIYTDAYETATQP